MKILTGDIRRKLEQQLLSKSHRNRERLRVIEEQKQQSIDRIYQASVNHGYLIGQDKQADKIVQDRMEEAVNSRLGKAQAFAELAECSGDLASEIQWWEVKSREEKGGKTIWNGYTLKRYLHFKFLISTYGRDVERDYGNSTLKCERIPLEFIVRLSCQGEYLVAVALQEFSGQTEALGKGKSPFEAFDNAYLAYFCGVNGSSITRDEIPEEIKGLAFQPLHCGLTGLSGCAKRQETAVNNSDL